MAYAMVSISQEGIDTRFRIGILLTYLWGERAHFKYLSSGFRQDVIVLALCMEYV